jgi:hypothetical protein
MYDRFDLQERFGVDDDICWLIVLVGPLSMMIFHRRFHVTRWLPPASSIVGGISLIAAIAVFGRMAIAANIHVPNGPFFGLGYAIFMGLSIFVGAACVLLTIGGLLSVVARRLSKYRQTHRSHRFRRHTNNPDSSSESR